MIYEPPVQYGAILINPATNEAFLDNRPLALTPTEFRVLYLLVRNKGGVVTHGLRWKEINASNILTGPRSSQSGCYLRRPSAVAACYIPRGPKPVSQAQKRWYSLLHGRCSYSVYQGS